MAASKDHPDFSKAKFKARVLAMKAGEKVAFAFALARRGDEHGLLFHGRKAGKPLLKLLTEVEPDLGKGTYGLAFLDGDTLVLDCERRLDGMKRAAKLWTKTHKHPAMKKVRVQTGG